MKRSFITVFLVIFAATAGVTLFGVTGVIVIREAYLNALFGSLLLELVAAMIALFRATKFFDESIYTNVDDYIPSDDAARVLMTLLRHQKKTDRALKTKFAFVVQPGGGDFPRFLRGLSELVGMGLVDVQRDSWQVTLTVTGYRIAQKNEHRFYSIMLYVSE